MAKNSRATPVCLSCLRPYETDQRFCSHCGETVGQLTPYIPYLSVPYICAFFSKLWRRVWFDRDVHFLFRAFSLLMVVFFVPIMLIGLPFVVVRWIRGDKPSSHDR